MALTFYKEGKRCWGPLSPSPDTGRFQGTRMLFSVESSQLLASGRHTIQSRLHCVLRRLREGGLWVPLSVWGERAAAALPLREALFLLVGGMGYPNMDSALDWTSGPHMKLKHEDRITNKHEGRLWGKLCICILSKTKGGRDCSLFLSSFSFSLIYGEI